MKLFKLLIFICAIVMHSLLIEDNVSAETDGIESNIFAVDGKNIYVPLPNGLSDVETGSEIEVFFDAGGVRIKVGIWQVLRVEAGNAYAEPVQADGDAEIDMIAVFLDSASESIAKLEITSDPSSATATQEEIQNSELTKETVETEVEEVRVEDQKKEQVTERLPIILPELSFENTVDLAQGDNQTSSCVVAGNLLGKSRERLIDGKLGEAKALLSAVDISNCVDLVDALIETQSKVALQIQFLDLEGQKSIAECSVANMRDIAGLIQSASVPDLQQLMIDLADKISNEKNFEELIEKIDNAMLSGQYQNASTLIDGVRSMLNSGAQTCLFGEQVIAQKSELLAKLSRATAMAEKAISTCRMDEIRNAVSAIRPVSAYSKLTAKLAGDLAERQQAVSQLAEFEKRYGDISKASDLPPVIAMLDGLKGKASSLPQTADCDRISRPYQELARSYQNQELMYRSSAELLKSCTRFGLETAYSGLVNLNENKSAAIIRMEEDVSFALAGWENLEQSRFRRTIKPRSIFDVFELAKLTEEGLSGPLAQLQMASAENGYCQNLVAGVEQEYLTLRSLVSIKPQYDRMKKKCTAQAVSELRVSIEALSPSNPDEREALDFVSTSLERIEKIKALRAGLVRSLENGSELTEIERKAEVIRQQLQAGSVDNIDCRGLTSDLEGVAEMAEKVGGLLAKGPDVLEYCGREEIYQFHTDTRGHLHPIIAQMHNEADRAVNLLEQFKDLPELVRKKDLSNFGKMLRKMSTTFTSANGICMSLGKTAGELSLKALSASNVVLQLEKGSHNCNLSTLDRFRVTLANKKLGEYFDLSGQAVRLKGITGDCRRRIIRQRAATCSKRHGINSLSTAALTSPLKCGCKNGYEMYLGSCKRPRERILEIVRKKCVQNYGSLTRAENVKSEFNYECKCTGSSVYWKNKCRILSGSELRTYANNSCDEQYGRLTIARNVKSANDFKCGCDLPNRWSSAQKCYRPSRQEMIRLGWEDCRRTYGNRLRNVIVQKNGQANCYLK
ncbi:MAG: hypothetical protein AAF478_04770 [Pseudomonadota bacterium]